MNFGPEGAMRDCEPLTLTLDEFEALRLADHEGLYHEQAARRMDVSRPTFSRILERARRKVAEALVQGRSLNIEGGNVRLAQSQRPLCGRCRRECDGSTNICPRCAGRRGRHGSGHCPREREEMDSGRESA